MSFGPGLPSLPDDPDESASVEMISAALRADTADVDTLSRVLTATLGDSLPPGMVSVERHRSLSDRMNGREGSATSITVTTPQVQLLLAPSRHRGGPVQAQVHNIVRGVVISRRDVSIGDWVHTLAQLLNDLAAQNAAARQSLSRLLGES